MPWRVLRVPHRALLPGCNTRGPLGLGTLATTAPNPPPGHPGALGLASVTTGSGCGAWTVLSIMEHWLPEPGTFSLLPSPRQNPCGAPASPQPSPTRVMHAQPSPSNVPVRGACPTFQPRPSRRPLQTAGLGGRAPTWCGEGARWSRSWLRGAGCGAGAEPPSVASGGEGPRGRGGGAGRGAGPYKAEECARGRGGRGWLPALFGLDPRAGRLGRARANPQVTGPSPLWAGWW